uniref:non-specific serine/threonine protein kinase n=1 Tax=viral metagenome TaxID=1070528 RepID=A0A6C0ESB6_9ZZZZ
MNDLSGVILSNKYKIVKLINEGTFCKLYEAIHIDKNIRVAIKTESSVLGKKILDNEINMYIYLKKYNLNIPHIKYIGTYNNYKYIVMKLLDMNLKEYSLKHKSINKYDCLIYDIFHTIYYFHQRNLVHRDIKPENFVFDENNNIYIIDLGLSAFYSDRKIKSFIGNKLFSSYNCHLSEYVYEHTDDLISVIYMLLYLYTGYLPWSNINTNYYELKKNTNYKDYYIKLNKYDNVVKRLLHIYELLHHPRYYDNILRLLGNTINSC